MTSFPFFLFLSRDQSMLQCADFKTTQPCHYFYILLNFSITNPGYDDKLHPAARTLISKLEILRNMEPPLNCCCSQVHPNPGW